MLSTRRHGRSRETYPGHEIRTGKKQQFTRKLEVKQHCLVVELDVTTKLLHVLAEETVCIHSVLDCLVRMDDSAMIPSAKVKAYRLQGSIR